MPVKSWLAYVYNRRTQSRRVSQLTLGLLIAEKYVVFVPAQSRKASARSQKVFKMFVQKKSGPGGT